ncbi:MAG: EAL domain-containing protein [Gammaproteobacteria bacterium]|nr:EAL domain-containing protein [Sideroxydans sp.]MBU3903949.1 EAL domain-containing protein [Gammaproteobacteria bacterium]MBU4150490.1 EAL domain-containing protein [Gammaproteobacteria bacterium]
MEMLPFLRRNRYLYLRYTLLGLVIVLSFASFQIFFVLPEYQPQQFIVPVVLGTFIGFLLSTLVAMRREIINRQHLFRAVADLAQEFIYVRNIEGVYEYVSPSCLTITGYSQADFYDQPHLMSRLVLEEDREVWDQHVYQMHEQGKPERLLIRIRARDGAIRWLEHICSDLRDEQGKLLGVRSTNLDVTERMLKERQLAIAATAFETHDAILITDAESRIIRANTAFTEITGYEPGEVIGKTPAILKSGKHDKSFYEEMWATLAREGRWEGELLDRRKNGDIYPKQLTITAVRNEQGKVTNYVGIFSDITTRKAAEEEINRLAYYDTLTSLPNRRLLIDRLQLAMAACDRNQSYGAVLFIDLDNFKELNDTQGHDVGDQLLVEVAHRLLACVRTGDTVARLGGDEFVVMLANLFDTELDVVPRAESVATKVLASLNLPYLLNGQQYHGTASIGVTLFHGSEKSIDELLKHSDVALYQAKNSGRATLRFFDPSMQQALELRARLNKDMHLALQAQQFQLYFQPQVDAAGCCIGAEVLLRWEHPERGLLFPNAFISHAEESGMIADIDFWVLREACQRLQRWQEKADFARIPLAVNVSAAAFMRADFVEDVLSIVNSCGVEPGLLKLELTETSLVDGVDEAIGKISRLKSAGIRFSLDDFGTGYSSLSYLRQLPISQLKIDRAFVRNVVTEPGDAMIAKTIIGMAQNLGLEVVAEGVETQDQLDLLVSFGCRTFQGYLFSRPLTLWDFEGGNWTNM